MLSADDRELLMRGRFALPAAALVLLAAALALYWGSLRHPLVFDDANLQEGFLRQYAEGGVATLRRRIAYQTFGWTWALAGTDWFWHRLLNVLLHAGAATALYQFLARLLEATGAAPRARWAAFFGALLFLLHPVAVYGVAYLIERPIIMATLFSLLSLWFLLEGMARGSRGWAAAGVAAYLAAVLSKEHAVMLPAAAVALAVLVRGPSWRELRPLAAPFAVLAVVAVAMVLTMKGVVGTMYEYFAPDALVRIGEGAPPAEAGRMHALSIVNQGYLFFRYLGLWLLPYPGWMSVDIRTPFPAELLAWPQAAGFLAWLAWPLAASALLLRRGRAGVAGFALLFPWLLGLTEFATVRVQEPFVLYRSYLWMCLLPALLPALLARLPGRWAFAVPAAACAVLVPAALDRLDTFSSPLKLWQDVVRRNGDSRAPLVERGYVDRGVALMDAGRDAEALRDFERALEINPRYADGYLGRSSAWQGLREPAKALADFERALALSPRYAADYVKRCQARMSLDQPRGALADCGQAAVQAPGNAGVHANLGVIYLSLGRGREARASFERTLEIDRYHPLASYHLAMMLLESGRRDLQVRDLVMNACRARIADACQILEGAKRR